MSRFKLKIYAGKFPSERPTARQKELLQKMGIRTEIILNCDRMLASRLIAEGVHRYYDNKPRRIIRRRW